MYLSLSLYMYIHVCMCVCMYVYIHIHVHIYIYIHIHVLACRGVVSVSLCVYHSYRAVVSVGLIGLPLGRVLWCAAALGMRACARPPRPTLYVSIAHMATRRVSLT